MICPQSARGKAVAIRGAMQAAGKELGFAANEIVPVRADIAAAPYNIDALWAKLIELVPEAQRARLLRTLGDIKSASSWAARSGRRLPTPAASSRGPS